MFRNIPRHSVASLSERGGCRITTIFETIGYILNGVIFLSHGYIEAESKQKVLWISDSGAENKYRVKKSIGLSQDATGILRLEFIEVVVKKPWPPKSGQPWLRVALLGVAPPEGSTI